jgi:DNA-binding SARP family transcriptional activator
MQEERLKLLLDFLEEEPNEPFNRYAVAMELMNSNAVRSIEHLEVLFLEHPTYLPTYYQLAQLYFDDDKLNEAENVYKKGIELAIAQGNNKAEKELNGAYQILLDEI